ncbi:MAG: hypothetical protein LBG29_07960 [Synergistaceae bacterium]|nr:hypothetical protein [Synergistaceae bacterium]
MNLLSLAAAIKASPAGTVAAAAGAGIALGLLSSCPGQARPASSHLGTIAELALVLIKNQLDDSGTG